MGANPPNPRNQLGKKNLLKKRTEERNPTSKIERERRLFLTLILINLNYNTEGKISLTRDDCLLPATKPFLGG